MRVLLIHTNREYVPQPVIPLGLSLIASALEAKGFQPRILDLCFSRRPEQELKATLESWSPEAVGLSIRNLDNGEYLAPRLYLPEIVKLAQICRRHSAAPLVIGGPAVSIAPRELRQMMSADYAVAGEGEEVFPRLVARLAAGQSVSDLPGVYSREDSAGAPARLEDLAASPIAQTGRWLDLKRYARGGASLPVQGKRGCALQCIYCTYRLIEGAVYRLRPPEAVVEEMQAAQKEWKIGKFEMVDATFNHPPEPAVALCEAIIRRGLKAGLGTMNFYPGAASPELFALMKRAGFNAVLCSVDSGSDTMLQILRKGFTVEQAAKTAIAAKAAGLPLLWSFLFGGPGETEATVKETLQFMAQALGPQDRIICTVGLRVYRGTELAELAVQEGAISPEADLVQPVFYTSPHLPIPRLLALLENSPRRSQMLYLNQLHSFPIPWALRLRSALRLPGPPWAALPIYNRLESVFVKPFKGKRFRAI